MLNTLVSLFQQFLTSRQSAGFLVVAGKSCVVSFLLIGGLLLSSMAAADQTALDNSTFDPVAMLEGEVFSQGYCSDDPFPAEGATIEVVGQMNTYSATADENGFYSLDFPADESPADVTASANDLEPGA